jgi:UDP-N-acetylmuramoylalanine-D-glutamate ligase
MIAPTDEVPDIPPLAGHPRFSLKRVMIAGGSAEGLYLAQVLEQNGIECTILDRTADAASRWRSSSRNRSCSTPTRPTSSCSRWRA